jgi:Tat protein translocase TatB subunit
VGSIGAPEIIVVFIVALLVLGPDRLPKAARQMGKAMAEFRRLSGGFQDEVRRAMDDTIEPGEPSSYTPPPDSPEEAVTRPSTSRPMTPADAELPPPPDDPSYN